MKTLFTIIIFLGIVIITVTTNAQGRNYIKNSGQYYWGEGTAQTDQEATKRALNELTQSISIRVTSEYSGSQIESGRDLRESVKSIINTYSIATITNPQKIITPLDGLVDVFIYMDKNELAKIFEERKKLVCDIYQKAIQYEAGSNIGYALKWYYYSIILMNSIPTTNLMFDGKNLVTEVPYRINNIINNTKFTVTGDRNVSDNEREITFRIETFDKPVQMIEFNYWDGSSQVQVRGIDGEGVLRLLGGSMEFDRLSLDVKYSFYESRDEIKEIGELWDLVIKPVFASPKQVILKKELTDENNLGKKIESEKPKEKSDSQVFINETGSNKLNLYARDSCDILNKIGKETLTFLELLKSKTQSKIDKYYTSDPFLYNKIKQLVKYNNPSVVGSDVNAEISKTATGWELRKIRVINKYLTINKLSSEYLVLDFKNDGSLYDITYGVPDDVYKKVQYQSQWGNDWNNRQTILKFVEKYRTAFLCRNITAIDSMFADEAVIIVGRYFQKTSIKDIYKYMRNSDQQPEARYIQYTKEQYLKNLANLFKKTGDIYIGYNTLEILSKNNQKVYGISMRQNYNATNYADEGYLFLLVDFEDVQPQIYVRAWQPKEWDEQSLIRLSNFNINRAGKN